MNEIARKKRELSRQAKILAVTGVLTAGLIAVLCSVTSYAASVTVDLGAGNAGAQFGVLEALLVVTLLALAPTLLIMMTSFTRIVIVLSFLRNALGTQQSPPSQVLIGLSLFLTMFIMWPVFTQINEEAYQPYRAGTITQQQALELIRRFIDPMEGGMSGQGWQIGELPSPLQLTAFLRTGMDGVSISRMLVTAWENEQERPVDSEFYEKHKNPFRMAVNGEHMVYIEVREC